MYSQLASKRSSKLFLLTALLVVIFTFFNGFLPNSSNHFGISSAIAANYPLDIINIKKSGASNRIRLAYPGLEYSITVAVRGGTYPFKYALTNAPVGMSINQNTGRILWPTPVATGSPHSITISVTDAENTVVSESWTINVSDTNGKFFFVDSVNGRSVVDGGTGTINNPWANISDFYKSETNNSYSGAIIYFRTGKYTLWHPPGTSENERGGGSDRIFFRNNHPITYLAYPNEKPVINLEGNGSTGKNFYLDQVDNFYLQGIEFENVLNYALEIANCKNLTIIDCNFKDLSMTVEGANQAHIAYFGSSSLSNYNTIIDNILTGGAGTTVSGIKTYGVYYSVIERNTITSMPDGISIKSYSDNNSIRKNILKDNGTGISLMGYGSTSNNEFSYNFMYNNNSPLRFSSSGLVGATHIFRNTIYGGEPQFRLIKSTEGIFYISNNIVLNALTDSESYGQNFSKNKYRFFYLTNGDEQNIFEKRFIFNNDLKGTTSGDIIDSNGKLTTEYKKTYLGIVGWETAGGMSPPQSLKAIYVMQSY